MLNEEKKRFLSQTYRGYLAAMIYVEPRLGLCNRMRSLDSAIGLSQKTRVGVKLVWIRNTDCNASFEQLFQIPEAVTDILEVSSAGSKIMQKGWLQPLHRIYRRFWSNDDAPGLRDNPAILESAAAKGVYIRGCERFYSNPQSFSQLRPSPSIQQMVDNYKFENTVGVYIRRTDNSWAKDNSPLELFISAMQQLIAENSSVRFFLATDDPATEQALKAHFGDRIWVHLKRTLDRNHPKGIEDAMVDLFSLASCTQLLASYWSSFSDVAAQIRQIKKTVIAKQA